jgi:hypothetical protein
MDTQETTQGKNWANYLTTHIPIVQNQALDSLRKAQERQKKLYDNTRRKAQEFKLGDLVFLKKKKKKKSTDIVGFTAARWTGPWKVLRRTNDQENANEITRWADIDRITKSKCLRSIV